MTNTTPVNPIIEYERVNPEIEESILTGYPYYYLKAEKDMWLFPWESEIPLNIKGLFLPDHTTLFVEGVEMIEHVKVINPITVTPAIASQVKIRAKARGVLPRKIYAGQIIAKATLLVTMESHVVDYYSK